MKNTFNQTHPGRCLLLLTALTCCVSGGLQPAVASDNCCSYTNETTAYAKKLDTVAKFVEEWGTISLSAPLVTDSQKAFKFELELDDKAELYNAKRTEGNVLDAISSALRGSLSVEAQFGPGNTPGASKATAADSTATNSLQNLDRLLTLFTNELSLDPRHKIRLAASDRAELNLHRFFVRPDGLDGQEQLRFVPFTVSLRPGWRAGNGSYVGQMDVEVRYAWVNADGQEEEFSSQTRGVPRIVAVYPGFDTQELNLEHSRHRLVNLALELAAVHQFGAGKGVLNYAREHLRESQTASSLNQIVSYVQEGRSFGFEFRPAFRAKQQPDSARSKPGFVLEPVTFPAFALVAVDTNLLTEGVRKEAVRYALERLDDPKRQAITNAGLTDVNRVFDLLNGTVKANEPTRAEVEQNKEFNQYLSTVEQARKTIGGNLRLWLQNSHVETSRRQIFHVALRQRPACPVRRHRPPGA